MSEQFNKEDYMEMMVNCTTADPLDTKDYLDIFPKLKMYPEFSVDLGKNFNRNQVIAYICYTYDMASPIRKKYQDLGQRKYEALLMARFKHKEHVGFGQWVDHMVSGGIPEINSMIVAYVKMANSTKYSMLITAEALFYSYLKASLEGDTKIKSDELLKVEQMLITAQRQLLAEDNGKELVQTLYKKINNVIDYSPEEIAARIRDKGYENVFADED